jgi:hypothetical protein
MFNPSRDQARHFWVDLWLSRRDRQVFEPMERHALDLIESHPEYHPVLEDPDSLIMDFTVERGDTNPFLHLSMHLAVREQLSINQPIGIVDLHQMIALRRGGSLLDADHVVMEALAEQIWQSQRNKRPFDSAHYLHDIKRLMG